MKKKVLFVATVASHINAFHIPDIKFFQAQGWEVHVAVGVDPEIRGRKEVKECDVLYVLPMTRSPFKFGNIKAIRILRRIIREERFSLIHCHTPMGGVVGRLAGKHMRKKSNIKVLYTCHGAHFFSGAPLKNWLIYYPVEKFLARYTDGFIAINKEDYDRAKRKIKARKIEYLPGVGFKQIFHKANIKEKLELRDAFGYDRNDFILTYVGELSTRKNQSFLLDVMRLLVEGQTISKLKLLLVGIGEKENALKEKCRRFNMEKYVDFLGYRNDVDKILNLSDIYVASSKHEGLAVNILEALGSGLPVVATEARGQSDVIEEGENGFIIFNNDVSGFANKILFFYKLQNEKEKFEFFRDAAVKSVEKYTIPNVRPMIENLYLEYME